MNKFMVITEDGGHPWFFDDKEQAEEFAKLYDSPIIVEYLRLFDLEGEITDDSEEN